MKICDIYSLNLSLGISSPEETFPFSSSRSIKEVSSSILYKKYYNGVLSPINEKETKKYILENKCNKELYFWGKRYIRSFYRKWNNFEPAFSWRERSIFQDILNILRKFSFVNFFFKTKIFCFKFFEDKIVSNIDMVNKLEKMLYQKNQINFIKSPELEKENLSCESDFHDEKKALEIINSGIKWKEVINKGVMRDQNVLFKLIKKKPGIFYYFPEKYKKNVKFVLKCIKINTGVFKYVSPLLKKQIPFLCRACMKGESFFKFAIRSLISEEELAEMIILEKEDMWEELEEHIKNDEKIMSIIAKDPKYTKHVELHIKNIELERKKYKKFVINEVSKNGLNLKIFNKIQQNDKEVVLIAIKQNPEAFRYAGYFLRKEGDFLIEAVSISPDVIKYAIWPFSDDFFKKLIEEDFRVFEYASDSLKQDGEFVKSIVRKYGAALQYVAGSLRTNREIVLLAVSNCPMSLNYAIPVFDENDDRELMKNDSKILQIADKAELRLSYVIKMSSFDFFIKVVTIQLMNKNLPSVLHILMIRNN